MLHMLRMMMYDWDSKSDHKFEAMMRDYYRQFRGKRASTNDFQNIVENHFGQSMEWFFDYWIYGTDIPRYNYAYEIDEKDGNYSLHCTFVQDETQKFLPMPVPVEIIYSDDSREYFTVQLREGKTTGIFSLKEEPDEVIINPFHAVLAEMEEYDFEDL